MDNPIVITATQVYKTYHDKVEVPALRGADLKVRRGEMVAIMGPSGCGKTTLLNCLSGLDSIDSGEIIVEGTNIQTLSDKKRTEYRAHRMGFVFQFYNLLPVLNAVENVELPLLVAGVNPSQARQRALEMLGLVELGHRSQSSPAELSGGQRQRVTIARALVNAPAIIWGDEPTGDLDSGTADEIMDLFQRLNRENGQTFVLVTHSDDVSRRTHRIVRMRDGHIVSEEPASQAAPAREG